MANFKKKSDKDVVENLMEDVKQEQPEIVLDDKDEIESEEPITIEKQYTRVFIGQWYTFEPKRVYRVDENVKSKLQNAGLLLPL